MPGPSNSKGKGKARGRNQKRTVSGTVSKVQTPGQLEPLISPEESQEHTYRPRDPSSEQSTTSTPSLKTPPPILPHELPAPLKEPVPLNEEIPRLVEEVMFQEPFIHDPGNGPRVRDASAFIGSFFAQPAALDDPMCAEFAQEEVLQMLRTVLPEEISLILWYNKSRSHSRVCPACQRLYRLGDTLPDLLDDSSLSEKPPPHQQMREQSISGICSPVCFVMALFNYPSAIKSAWGAMADEMDESTWDILNGPEDGITKTKESRALGMLVKMTRLHDLGLAQLCFDPHEVSILEAAAAR